MNNIERAKQLTNQFNKITNKLAENLETADDLQIKSNDIIDYLDQKTLKYSPDSPSTLKDIDLFNLYNLMKDFNYIRDVIIENTENGRHIIKLLSSTLIDLESESSVALINSFAEINHTLSENMRLFINSYKELSNIIINFNKAKNTMNNQPKITNNLNITTHVENGEPQKTILSTAELIKQLQTNQKL